MTIKTQIALSRIHKAIDIYNPIAVFGLFSGGHDSVTATAIASMHPRFTAAVHINTGIGIERTRQYVRETCALRGWLLKEYEAEKHINANGEPDPQRYRDFVMRWGFPGQSWQGRMYSRLKERALERLQREYECTAKQESPRRAMFVSGCRSDESERRMANTEEVQIDGQRIWCAPIHDWSKLDTAEFMEHQGIPRNPVVDLIHKSGECLCGAFAKKGELAELALWPETRPAYERIVALEKEGRLAGFPWGWEDAPPDWFQERKKGQQFLLDYDSDEPQHLCWSCNKRHEQTAP